MASACRLRRNSDFRLNSEAVNERSGGFTFPYAILASVTAGPAPSDRFLCIPHLSYQLPFRGSGLNGQKRYVKQYFSNTLSDSRQCVFSISEISLAASRKIKLKLLADEGNVNAQRVLKMQENPGTFFTVVQIGLNAVAILGGIVGDAAFSPAFHSLLSGYLSPELSEQLSFIISFTLVTSLFILFADLTPKRIGMIAPETVALRIINPMRFCLLVFRPLVWLFNGMANMIFRIFKLPMVRKDDITSDDIYAVVEAGALAGVLRKQEHELIENVFELESRTVPSSMTPRESVIWFDLHEDEQSLKNKVAEHPHSKFLVCNEDIDHIIGYVDSKDLLNRVLANQSLVLTGGVQIRNTLIVPDTLTLSEALESFKTAGEDFAVIMNEYALVVGIITLNDVMTTLMGDLVGQGWKSRLSPAMKTRG